MQNKLSSSKSSIREENLFSVMSVRALLENSENTLATIESEMVEGKDMEALYDSIKCVQSNLNSALTKLIGIAEQGVDDNNTEDEFEEEEPKAENGSDNERCKKKIKTS